MDEYSVQVSAQDHSVVSHFRNDRCFQTFQDDVPKFLQNPVVQNKLETAKKLSEVNSDDYDAVFYVGGHGPVLDLASDPVNIQLASAVRA